MKKQINNVNVEKAIANAKANSLIALDVLKSVKEKNAGLFKTSLGTKTEIYKKELFEGANEKQIKSLRKKFRNVTFNFLSTIATNADKKLIDGFIDFYKQVYTLNDFSFNSIAKYFPKVPLSFLKSTAISSTAPFNTLIILACEYSPF